MPPPDGIIAGIGDRTEPAPIAPLAIAPVSIRWSGTWVLCALGGSLALLWTTSLCLPLIFQAAGGINREAYRLLDVRFEGNLPTLFATIQLLVAAALCFLIARLDRAQRRYWLGLAIVFSLLGIDETAQLHELLAFVKLAIAASIAAESTWAVFYGPAAAVIAILYLPFLRRLPLAVALSFAFGGAIFIMGSLGLEVLGTYHAKLLALPRNHGHFSLQIHIEELCELLGVFLFVHGAVRFLQRRWPHIQLSSR